MNSCGTERVKNFLSTALLLVCYRAVFSVVTQRSSPLITGAQPKAVKMQTVRFFNVTLLGIYR